MLGIANKKDAKRRETQSERLDRILRESRRIREAYERGEISEVERQEQLVEIKRPNTLLGRLSWSIFGI